MRISQSILFKGTLWNLHITRTSKNINQNHNRIAPTRANCIYMYLYINNSTTYLTHTIGFKTSISTVNTRLRVVRSNIVFSRRRQGDREISSF